MAYASVIELSELLTDKNYQRYNKIKQKIKSKYPKEIFPSYIPDGRRLPDSDISELQRTQYLKYLKELGDLLLKPKGPYQKFTWDYLVPPGQRREEDIRSRGTSYGGKIDSSY